MEKPKISVRTLAIIRKNNRFLLGRKKKEGFGYSKWNGLGGKVEKCETVDEAMVRECQEEAFITPTKFKKQGIINFHYLNEPIHEVHIYDVREFSGEPNHSDEMEVAWYESDKIPYKDMWVDDEYWWPTLLTGARFAGEFFFNEQYQIVSHKIQKVRELPK